MNAGMLELEFFHILRAFGSLVDPNRISIRKCESFTTLHTFLLEEILLSPHFHQYPPSRQYQRSFWKWAIQLLESIAGVEDSEIDPRIYEYYLTLLPPSGPPPGQARMDVRDLVNAQALSPLQKPPEQSYMTYFWKNPRHIRCAGIPEHPTSPLIFETVTLRESRTTIENGTTGLRTWLASFILSEYLTRHAGLVTRKRVLELGSGIGYLGAIVASLQQTDTSGASLWLTDINEDVLSRCRDNLKMPCSMSSSHPEVNHVLLDWSDSQDSSRLGPLTSLLQEKIDPDIILGADLAFDPTLTPALVGVLRLALQPSPTRTSHKIALIAATVRNEETLEHFVQCIERMSLQAQEVQFETERDAFMQNVDVGIANVKIFRVLLE